MVSPDRIVLQRSSRQECTSGVFEYGRLLYVLVYCFAFTEGLSEKGGRGQNSKRECVQGIFTSTYVSLFEGVKKGSHYFFNSLSEAPSSFSMTTPTLVIICTLTFPVCLSVYCDLEFVFCLRHLLFLSGSVYLSWFRFGLQQSDEYNKYKMKMSCISHTVDSLKLTAHKNSYCSLSSSNTILHLQRWFMLCLVCYKLLPLSSDSAETCQIPGLGHSHWLPWSLLPHTLSWAHSALSRGFFWKGKPAWLDYFLCFNTIAGNRTNGSGFKQKQREKGGRESKRKKREQRVCVRERGSEWERKTGRFF